MRERGITIEEMRKALGVSRNQLSCVVNGRKPIRTDLAVKLAEVTGTTPSLWLNLQNKFDIWQAHVSLSPAALRRLKSYHASFEQRTPAC
jgi:addiction module HigA family antidote